MSLGIVLYTLAIVTGIIASGGIITISEYTNKENNQQHDKYDSHSYDAECFRKLYYPCEDNISIKLGDNQTFSIYPNIPYTTWALDNKEVYQGQTYTMYTSDKNIGIYKVEVYNIIDKRVWYVYVTR